MHIEIDGKEFTSCPYCGGEVLSVQTQGTEGDEYYVIVCPECCLGWEMEKEDWPVGFKSR